MTTARFAALLVGAWVSATSAFAQPPVAIVENVTGNPAGVGFMDYVETGKVIRLGLHDAIVLGYLKSCVRETISGGTVEIGVDQSDVQYGRVARTKVECDAGKMLLAPGHAYDAAGLVFRGLPDPQFTLFGLCPVFEVKGGGTLVIERLDRLGERYVLPIGGKQLVRGAFFDLATTGRSLAPGGIYKASWNATDVVFKVAPHAKPGRSPIAGRLLRFGPAG
jgi:hypothetical protein